MDNLLLGGRGRTAEQRVLGHGTPPAQCMLSALNRFGTCGGKAMPPGLTKEYFLGGKGASWSYSSRTHNYLGGIDVVKQPCLTKKYLLVRKKRVVKVR